MSDDRFAFYKEYPKTCRPDDFWGQVKRTVNGVPVSNEQIQLILDAVTAGLELEPSDELLDLCCGNGALSDLLFRRCVGGLGVDFSEYLISIAGKYFATPPTRTYMLGDVVEFCRHPVEPQRFSKALCYGSFSFLEADRAECVLASLSSEFPRLTRIFIGNYPDKDRFSEFFGDRPIQTGVENDPSSPIGIWRTQEEFGELARRTCWRAEFKKMPEQYYAAHYRYDVVLSR